MTMFKRMTVGLIAIALFTVGFAGTANAATLTWDGDTNNEFHTAANWNPDTDISGGAGTGFVQNNDLTVSSGTPSTNSNVVFIGGSSMLINGGDVTWSGRYNTIGAGATASAEITSGSLTVNYNGGSGHAFKVGDNNGSDGTIVQSGGTVTATNANDWLELAAGQSGAQGTYRISGGTLNAGRVSNGSAGTGLFHIIGDAATINLTGSDGTSYSQNAASTLELDINGISAIDATDAVSLAGTLDVEFLATPTNGQTFDIINYGSLSGTFDTFDTLVDSPLGADTITLSIDYGTQSNDAVVLAVTNVIPEPASLALLGLGGLLIAGRRRRRQ